MAIVIDFLREVLNSTYQAAIGALIVVIFATINRSLLRRPFRRIWDVILGSNEKKKSIVIVMPSITMVRLGKPEKKTWDHMPKNINLLTLPEAIGVAELIEKLRNAYKDLQITICSDEEFNDYDKNFISIGGPSVNIVSKNLLITREIDKYFKIQYPEHGIIDTYDSQQYSVLEKDQEVLTDYGFTFLVQNPLYSSRYCVICMGVWPFGTTSAIRVLFGGHSDKVLSSQINRNLKKRKSMLVISKTQVQHYFGSPPKLIKVRELKG